MARSWRWLSAARRLIVRSSCTSANDLGPIKNNTAKIRNPMVVEEGSIHAAAAAGHHDRSCDSKKDDGGGGGDSGKKKIVVRREPTAREQSAAIIIQACFRAHLARRAFRALKSLVRLQAVVRGACVRRQARVAVQCMQALVRLQVRVRARHLLAVGRSGGHR